MKKILLILPLVFLLVSCSEAPVQNENASEIISLSQHYEFVTPYRPQESYTYYSKKTVIDKYEVDNINLSLMAIAQEYFSTQDYYFMEDQYFNVESQKNLIDLVNPKIEETINNKRLIPEYLIGVQVQNYTLNSDGSELGGIAIGLVLDQNQEYINENGSTIRTTIEETELINSMKLKLPVIVEYFRSIPEFDDIEMVIGLYIVDNSNDLVPGSYIQYGHVGNNSNRVVSLSNYTIREALLPSSKAKAFDEEFHQKFIDFVDATKSSYEQNVGIIGRIRYTESKIEKVSISIKSSRNNKTFLLSLTQTVYNELINNFDDSYDVEVVISTYDKVEATITKSGNSNFVVTTYE